MENVTKRYFSYNEIHRTVADLAREILASGFEPDVTVAIGTGGFIPARILKTFLKKPILTVGVKLYTDDNQIGDGPKKVQWIDEVERKLKGRKVLLIDEVDDSRTARTAPPRAGRDRRGRAALQGQGEEGSDPAPGDPLLGRTASGRRLDRLPLGCRRHRRASDPYHQIAPN